MRADARGVTVGDFNGDGRLDLATANPMPTGYRFCWARAMAPLPRPGLRGGRGSCVVTVGDFNGDGRLDLATANFGADTVSILINTTVSEVAEVITFEGLEAGARITEVFGNRGSGPVFVQGTNPLLSSSINAAVVFDSACPPGGMPGDCTGEDMDLGTPNEAFGGPGVGVVALPAMIPL